MKNKQNFGFWMLITVAVLLGILLLVGQTVSLFAYELTVSWGLQESVDEITDVGIAFAKGFAFADTVFYLPLLIAGIIGLIKRTTWGRYAMLATLGITVYWPMVNLFAIWSGKDVMNLLPEKYVSFSIILSLFTIYGLWGIWYLYKYQKE